jgi:hypothetical protein
MTVTPAPPGITVPTPARPRPTDALRDGTVAGGVAAIVLILWFLALDLVEGRELPSVVWVPLAVLERLTGGALSSPAGAVIGVILLGLGCCALGAALAWLLARLPRSANPGAILTVSFLGLQLAFLALDRVSGAGLLVRLRPWAVVAANVLAAVGMTLTLWKREPRMIEGRRDLWDDEP